MRCFKSSAGHFISYETNTLHLYAPPRYKSEINLTVPGRPAFSVILDSSSLFVLFQDFKGAIFDLKSKTQSREFSLKLSLLKTKDL